MIHRLASFDFDDRLKATASLEGREDEVWIESGRARPNGNVLLVAGIDTRVELTSALCLQQPNDPVMLELLANGPHQDRTHLSVSKKLDAQRSRDKTRKCNMELTGWTAARGSSVYNILDAGDRD